MEINDFKAPEVNSTNILAYRNIDISRITKTLYPVDKNLDFMFAAIYSTNTNSILL